MQMPPPSWHDLTRGGGGRDGVGGSGLGSHGRSYGGRNRASNPKPVMVADEAGEDDGAKETPAQQKGKPEEVVSVCVVLTGGEATGGGRQTTSCKKKGTEMAFEATDAACRFCESVVTHLAVDPMTEEAVSG